MERVDGLDAGKLAKSRSSVQSQNRPPKMSRGSGTLSEEAQRRTFEQIDEVLHRTPEIGGRIEDLRVCHDTEEFVDTGPGNRPRVVTDGKVHKQLSGAAMVGKLLAARVEQDGRVERDHWR